MTAFVNNLKTAILLGALFGRKVASAGTVGRATTAARGAGRAARERALRCFDPAAQAAALFDFYRSVVA